MIDNGDLIGGIILSGGESYRKGLINFWGKQLIEYPIGLLTPICGDLIVSTDREEFDGLGISLVEDEYKSCGPVGGIHAALKASKYDWNVILSCDSPFLHLELINELLNAKDGYQAVVPVHDGGIEPFVGLYHKSLADFFEEKILIKELNLQKLLKELNVNYINAEPFLYKFPLLFQKFNAHLL